MKYFVRSYFKYPKFVQTQKRLTNIILCVCCILYPVFTPDPNITVIKRDEEPDAPFFETPAGAFVQFLLWAVPFACKFIIIVYINTNVSFIAVIFSFNSIFSYP